MLKKIMSGCLVVILIAIHTFVQADDVVVKEEKINLEELKEVASIITAYPKINSEFAVVVDRESKAILYGKNEMEKTKMASTTKIMTALVTLERTDLKSMVKVSPKAAGTGGSKLKLKAGDILTVEDLLYGLLLRSGNDAAVALSEYVAGGIELFADLMNQKAKELGLENTHFETPHGLDAEKHYTTAYELALLTDAALKNEVFKQIVGTKTYSIKINGIARKIDNTNELLGNLYGVYGVKTGFTNGAGRCLVTGIKRDNLDIICVVLGSDTKKMRTKDSIQLIEYIFQNYKVIDLSEKIMQEFSDWKRKNQDKYIIEKGAIDGIKIKLGEYYLKSYPVKKSAQKSLQIHTDGNFNLKAPLKENSKVGSIKVSIEGKEILTIDILNEEEIKKKGIRDYLLEFVQNYMQYLSKAAE